LLATELTAGSPASFCGPPVKADPSGKKGTSVLHIAEVDQLERPLDASRVTLPGAPPLTTALPPTPQS
jgi:hypothetical protein